MSVNTVMPILIALIFHGIDIVTGLIAAFKEKSIESGKMRDGLFKKIGFIFCYVLAFLIDYYGNYVGLNLGVKVLPIIVLYSVTTEVVSIIENIGRINTDLLPDTLKHLFHIEDGNKE